MPGLSQSGGLGCRRASCLECRHARSCGSQRLAGAVGGAEVGFAAGTGTAAQPQEFLTDGPKREMGGGRCERVSGKSRERKGSGPREEQGNGREKEAFKDCVRFVVTEGDRAQPGRGGLLATTGVMVVSPGVLERGGTGGQDRSVSIVRSARCAAGIAARSPFSQEGSVCQTANVVSPAEARFTKIHSTLCREVPPVSGKTARTVGYSQSNLPASRVPHQHFSLRAVTQELSNDRPQCPSHQTRGSAFQGLTAATPSCHLQSIFCCEAGPVNHFWPFSKGIGPWQRWKAARPPGKPR